MSIDARVPKIFCLELASKLQKDLDLLPCVYVKDLKKADILLVGPDFKGELEEYLTLGVIPVLPINVANARLAIQCSVPLAAPRYYQEQ